MVTATLSLMAEMNSAFAQSSVTLYGIVDSGVLYTSKTADASTGNNAGHQFALISGGMTPSLIGLKGAEDLGGGLKAIFALESGIDVSTGGFSDSNGFFFGRQAWVGLQGEYGTVKAGLQYSPFVLSIISTDARGVSYFGSIVPIYLDAVAVTGIFNANAVSYTSPTIGGFQGSAMLALGGGTNFQDGRQYSASVNYTYGPAYVSVAMYSGNSGGGTAASTPAPSTVAFSGRTVGAGYRWDALTLKVVFVNLKVAGGFDNRVFGGGGSYQLTPSLSADAGVWYTTDGNNSGNHSVLAATSVIYQVSRATSFYGQLGFVENHGAMRTGLSANGALDGVPGGTVGVDVGIRHMF
ncbi:porin [Burkholderia cenocepacia]|nr:porin [Burkholderia cenocepacia]MDR5644430.1 porin [Burkholderia cenocepacia]